jgi:hypothetical protein
VAQFARPASDIAIGSWTTQGGSAASLWATLDEDPADEADFAQSSLTVNDSYETLLSPVEAAFIDRLHLLRYRGRKNAAAGNTRGVTVDLLQGTTVIATNSHPDLTVVWLDGAILLTKEQGAAITDYTNLRVRFTATGSTASPAGNRRRAQVSWCQLRVPDVAELLEDWRTRWGVPAEVTTIEQLLAWLEPQTWSDPQDPVWVRRYRLAIAVWKLSAYRPMLAEINAGTYPLPAHQTQEFAASKIAGKLTRFQSIADTLDAEDTV